MRTFWRGLVLAVCLLMFSGAGIASAMVLNGIQIVMKINNYSGSLTDCAGDLGGVRLFLNGEAMKLQPYLTFDQSKGYQKIGGGYVKLLSQDGSHDYLSFPVGHVNSMFAYKITSDVGKDFLLVRLFQDAADGSSQCKGLWLVGKYGEEYITFVTLDSVINGGLVFDNITPSIQDGEIRLTGYARMYGTADPKGGMAPLGHKGARFYPMQEGKGNYCTFDPVQLFWDDTAQWFGIRRIG